jgi:pimeloyl-ACP methyl ester carboxylesterase
MRKQDFVPRFRKVLLTSLGLLGLCVSHVLVTTVNTTFALISNQTQSEVFASGTAVHKPHAASPVAQKGIHDLKERAFKLQKEEDASADSQVSNKKKAQTLEAYGRIPLYFIENHGQMDRRVKFYEKGHGHATFFTEGGIYLCLIKNSEKPREKKGIRAKSDDAFAEKGAASKRHGADGEKASDGVPSVAERRVLKLTPLGMKKGVNVVAKEPQAGKVNYLLGNDPEKWRTNVPTCRTVVFEEAYPGIDLKFYGNNRQLEYDIVVKPGGDPSQVKFRCSGMEGLEITAKGDMAIRLGDGETVIQKKPIIYQEIDGERVQIDGRFKIYGDTLRDASEIAGPTTAGRDLVYGFEVACYEKSESLIIDPILVYSTYLGGSLFDTGAGIAVDGVGYAYVTGKTSSADFPTEGALYAYSGVSDVFVTKLNAEGTALIYSTYLGGSSADEANSIAVNSAGCAYVSGYTCSADFPTEKPLCACSFGAFVTKLNADGTALVYSTYLRYDGLDCYAYDIAVDSSGCAYVTGEIRWEDFPESGPSTDAFATKLNADGTALVYSIRLAGSSNDCAHGIAVDSAGCAYVTGGTGSADFPTKNALYVYSGGYGNAFVTKLNAEGTALVYSTYLGGSWPDVGWGIAVDSAGCAYVTGRTNSADFPTEGALYLYSGGYGDAFVTKLNAEGTALVYSTYLGGSELDRAYGIEVDIAGGAYVTGKTDSEDFPTEGALYTYSGGYGDAFVAKLNADGTALVYSTYLGGTSDDGGDGIAVDGAGCAYVTGRTYSADFPTHNAIYSDLAGSYDAFVIKICEAYTLPDHFSFSVISSPQAVGAPFQVTISARNSVGGIVPDFNGQVALASNVGSVSPTSVRLVNGQKTVLATLYNQGTARLSCNGHGAYGESNYCMVSGASTCQGSIWGNVVDLRDDPVWEAEITLYDLEGIQAETSVLTDTDGKFSFTGLACDTYELRVEKEGAVKEGIEVAVSGDLCNVVPDITIPLNPGIFGTPVILLPGMMGSSIGEYSPYPKLPLTWPAPNLHIHWPGYTGWKDLKSYFLTSGFNVFECPWDWRMKISHAYKRYLIPKINEALSVSTTGKVHIVAHSMGGLVARAYIQGDKYADRNDVDKLVMVGTPSLGSCNPYYIWEGGNPKLVDDITDSVLSSPLNIYSNTIQNLWEETYKKKWWSNFRHKPIRDFVRDKCPSLLQLMNTENFLTDGSNDRGVTTAGNENSDLKDLNTDPDIARMSRDGANGTVQAGLFIGNKSGETIEKIIVHAPKADADLYEDGRPKWPKDIMLVWGNGDGTVPYASSVWPYNEAWAALVAYDSEESHTKLIKDYVEEIYAFLAGDALAQSIETATVKGVEAGEAAISVLSFSVTGQVRFCVTDPTGNRAGVDPVYGNPLEEIPDSRVIFGVEGGEAGIEGPVDGTYSLTVFGESERDFHIDAGYADADHTETHDLWGYCSGGRISFQVTVSAAADPRITILPPAIKPEGVQADPYPSDAITCTSLSWLESTEEGVTSYNIYSAGDTHPYFTKIATLPYGTTCLETTDLWAGDDAVPIKTYAVTAVKGDGSESFFSERAQNNDRDHDGLTDAEEVEYGSDMNNSDTDGDGLIDGEEFNYGTNPLLTDTDGDGFSDYKEIQAGSDPLDENLVPPCPGDFDGDGDVVGSDVAVFAADFGRTDCDTGEECEGDFDGDNDVDGSDLAVFAADFGRTDCP